MDQFRGEKEGLAASVLDVMLAPVAVISEGKRIVQVNKAWRSRCEVDPVGHSYLASAVTTIGLAPDQLRAIGEAIEAVQRTGKEVSLEAPYALGGDEGWYVVRIAPMPIRSRMYVAVFHNDLSNRVQIRNKLLASEAENSVHTQILQHIKDAVISCDLKGFITAWNAGAERIFGYAKEEVIGRNIRLIQPSHDFSFDREVVSLLRTSGTIELEGLRRHKSGKLFYAHTSVSFLRDASGRETGVVGYTIDITEKKRIQEELEASLLQLEDALRTANELSIAAQAASEAKSEFLANVSHEIRTPMNGIVGMTELLLGTKLDAEQLDYTSTIKRSAASLLKVLNDVLDFSKIEKGKVELDAEPFDIRLVLEELVDLMAPQAQAKGLALILAICPGCPHLLHGDALRLRQIVTNLLANAIKFTDTGEVELGVTAIADGESQALLRVYVRDTGVGIPTDRQEAVFESFTQADSSTTRKHGGTGLGLSICRSLCELMQGDLHLTSEVGTGSTFWIELPFDKQSVAKTQREADLSGLHFLVVEPTPAVRSYVQQCITYWGGTCDVAASWEAFVVDASKPDVVIADEGNDAPFFSRDRVIGLYPYGVSASSAPYASVLSKPIKLTRLLRAIEDVTAKFQTGSEDATSISA